MSSWIESWAGKAENFLNLVDKAAGEALQVELSEPAPIPIEWDSHQGFQGSERMLPRYIAPQQLYGSGSTGLSHGAHHFGSVSVPAELNHLQSMSGKPSNIDHGTSSAFVMQTVEATRSTTDTLSSRAVKSGIRASESKDRDRELFEFLNTPDASTPRRSPLPPSVMSDSTTKSSQISSGSYLPHSTSEGSPVRASRVENGGDVSEMNGAGLHEKVLALERENSILKNEVSSLNQELGSMIARGNKMQDELQLVHEKLAADGGQRGVKSVAEERRELCARIDDMQEALRSKDAQLAVLRVRLEEADRDLNSRRSEADRLRAETDGLQQSSSMSSASSCSTIDAVNVRLTETELLLEHERQTHKQFQEESMERLNTLEMEKQKLSAEVGSALRQLHEEKARSAELSAQQKISKTLSENSKQELNEYKEKAMRILQSKERLISSLRDGSISKSQGGDASMSAAELDGLRQERDMLREELHQTRLALETAKLEVTELESQLQQDQSSLQDRMRGLEERLSEEQNKHHDTEQELAKQKQEVMKMKAELSKQTAALQSRLDDRDSEINRLRNQLTTKSLSSNSQEELEGRLHLLTESLIQKQTMLETLSTEKNSLQLQLERMEKQYREAEASAMRASTSTVQLPDHNDARHRGSGLLAELSSDNNVTRQVKSAANSIDRFSVRLGVFLRRNPFARIFVILYMVLLHLWLMVIIMTYHQEVHSTNFDHQPIPPQAKQ